MKDAVEAYLALRRSLGYELAIEGEELRRFAAFADRIGHTGPVTTDLAVRWAKLPTNADPLYWARRLDVVRRFARHQALTEPGTEIPPRGFLGPSHRRPAPHIYSRDEIQALMQAAAALGPPGGLRPHTYQSLFGLLACTGLRMSEALRLKQSEVDLDAALIFVAKSKFRKSRWVPIHASTTQALAAYQNHRNRYLWQAADPHFFLTEHGTSLKWHRTYMTFRAIRERLGWAARPDWPRIHDLRHTFAVRTLLRWYEEGAPIGNKIAYLSTYLGHVKVSDTYWYLSAVPELLMAAAGRFEAQSGHDGQGTGGPGNDQGR
jgi:integrase